MNFGNIAIEALRTAFGVQAAAYALAAIGLNVQFGYAGLLNFGQVAFMMVGAYGTAVTITKGGPLWLGILVGLALAAVLALIMGLPTLRLRTDYLAIVTIAMAEILRLVNRSRLLEPLTNGVRGLQGFADGFDRINPIPNGTYGLGGLRYDQGDLWSLVVGWGLVILTSMLVWILVRSPWGRVLRSIREDEDAARSLGKNVFGYKLQSLVLGGMIGALGGILLALNTSSANPDSFTAALTFFAYVIVILGGPGTVWGPALGSIIFWFLLQGTDSVLRALVTSGHLKTLQITDVGNIRFALVGAGLMALMIFRPQGLFGNRDEVLIGER